MSGLWLRYSSSLSEEELNQVYRLWNDAYPSALHHENVSALEAYLAKLKNIQHCLAMNAHDDVIGWVATFTRNEARWFVVIVSPKNQRSGVGQGLMRWAMDREDTLFGWMIDHNEMKMLDGSAYVSPKQFYLKLGFRILEERLRTEQIDAVKIAWNKQ